MSAGLLFKMAMGDDTVILVQVTVKCPRLAKAPYAVLEPLYM